MHRGLLSPFDPASYLMFRLQLSPLYLNWISATVWMDVLWPPVGRAECWQLGASAGASWQLGVLLGLLGCRKSPLLLQSWNMCWQALAHRC